MTGILVDVTCPPPSTEGSELATLTNFAGNIGIGTGGVSTGSSPLSQQADMQKILQQQFARQQTDKDEARR